MLKLKVILKRCDKIIPGHANVNVEEGPEANSIEYDILLA